MATPHAASAGGVDRLAMIAAVLAAAAVGTMVVLAIIDHDGPGWILQPVLGLAAAATAWKAGGTSPRNMVAFAALIVGVAMALVFLGFVIAEA